MQNTLNDPDYRKIFSPEETLEKVAFARIADEDKQTELEVEFATEMQKEPLSVEAQDNSRADCIVCGKKRAGWTEATGICKCASMSSCDPMMGCKPNCDCKCVVKSAGNTMDSLIKSAFDSLMKVSSELDEAGFEELSANTLVLANNLVVEAKSKKMSKEDKAKEKVKLDKMKAKERAEKDKNDARDKKEREKAKLEKQKAKEKLEKEKSKKSGK